MPFALAVLPGLLAAPSCAQPGTLDPDFQGDGIGLYQAPLNTQYAQRVALQPDGRIIVLITLDVNDDLLARHLPDGTIDIGFGAAGYVDLSLLGMSGAHYTSMCTDTEGRILVCGHHSGSGFIARFGPQGTLDPSFGLNGLATLSFMDDPYPYGVTVDPDGKILVNFSTNAITGRVAGVARLLSNGQMDTSFSFDGAAWSELGSWARTYAMALQPDGKILIGGVYDAGDEAAHDYLQFIIRFTADGSRDTGFGISGEWTYSLGPVGMEWIGDIHVRGDGGITAIGMSGTGTLPINIVALTPAGVPDPAFSFDGVVQVSSLGTYGILALQPDGKLLAVGAYTTLRAIRLNYDGTYDLGFGTNGLAIPSVTGILNVLACTLQPDGKLLLAGNGPGGRYMLARMLTGLDVGIPSIGPGADLRLFPNPATEQVHLNYTLNTSEAITCALLDMQGRAVRTFFTASRRSAGEQRETLDLHGLAGGTYTLAMRSESHSLTTRIVKLQHP